jgi:Helix-turn-helix domain
VAEPLMLAIPPALLERLQDLIRTVIREELAHLSQRPEGFLDVNGAAAYLSSTPAAIRALVKRDVIPYHKAPNGRLLFDASELDDWAKAA